MHRSIAAWLHAALALIVATAMVAAQAAPEGGERPEHRRAPHGQYWDGAHGHNHYYPAPGFAVRVPPPHAHVVFWSGTRYAFHEGVWYAPAPHGYVVVHPPYGVVVPVLPAFRTAVVVGGLTFFYVNGAYYREVAGGYEAVAPPPGMPAAPGLPGEPPPGAAPPKVFVYPRQAQSPEQQATDEYECHRWAVGQSGFDPTASATGSGGGDAAHRSDYMRARGACLEGRGYTVR